MSKKIIGLLLAVCLVVGLVPVMASAADDAKAKVNLIGYVELAVTEGGAAKYAINKEVDLVDSKDPQQYPDYVGQPFKGWRPTTEGANADNWNYKLEWPTGGKPTLTLKGAKIDDYNETTKLYTNYAGPAIMPNAADFEVVIAENSTIEANNGVIYSQNGAVKNLTITSVGDAKLTGKGSFRVINPEGAKSITINANLDLENITPYDGWYGTMMYPIVMGNANLTIKGGNVNLKSGKQCIGGSANVVIDGGNVNIVSDGGMYEGAVMLNQGDITINGGTVSIQHLGKLYGGFALQTKKGNITITGGDVYLEGSMRTVAVPGKSDEDPNLEAYAITISGGTVEAVSTASYVGYGVFTEAPVLTGNYDAQAGADEMDADYYDDTMFNKQWFKYTATAGGATTGTAAPTTGTVAPTTGTAAPTTGTAAPTTGTAAPTTGTAAPTTGTAAPTTGTAAPTTGTTGSDNPATGDNGIVLWVSMLLVAAFGVVAVVTFGKKNSIVE